MEEKTCEICGKILPLSAFSKSYKGRCKECVARLTKEKRNGTAATTHKLIDWEQRRYEIAKDILCAIYMDEGNEKRSTDPGIEFEYQSLEGCASEAVRFADVLIEELKKQNHG
jgi:hypothetical protein